MKSRIKICLIALGGVIVLSITSFMVYRNMPLDYNSQQTQYSSFRLNIMSDSALIESFLRNVPGNRYPSYAPETQDEFMYKWLEASDILREFMTRNNTGKALWEFYEKEEPFHSSDDFNDLNDGMRFDRLETLLSSTLIQKQFTQEEKGDLEALVLEKMEERKKYPAVYTKAVLGISPYFGFRGKAPGYE